MKLTHVFGLVVAVHAAVFTVIFATPGCRSTGKSKPRPEDTDPAVAGSAVTPVDTVAATPVAPMSYDDVNAPVSPTPVASAEPVSPVSPVAPVSPVEPELSSEPATVAVRFAPSRPTTPVAQVSEPVSTAATHDVAKGDSLWSIAKKYGITVDELAAANQLSKTATLRLGQKLTVPAKAAAPTTSGFGAEAANTYAVKSGDTLGSIARKQGTTVAALRAANNLSGDNLRVGQKLVIPGASASLSGSPSAASSSAPQAGVGTYTIVAGDTLGSISRRSGVKVGDLALLNNITDPAKLRVGQVLKLPAGAKAVAAPAPAAPAYTPAPAPASSGAYPVESPTGVSPVGPVTPVEPAAVPVVPISE